jgi:hypothetical protein
MEETEIWKGILGFEGLYEVSNFGNIKSFKLCPSGFILKQTNKNGGYLSVQLCGKGNRPKTIRTHRIVAINFIPNPKNLPEVNHKDMNKQNNLYSNL